MKTPTLKHQLIERASWEEEFDRRFPKLTSRNKVRTSRNEYEIEFSRDTDIKAFIYSLLEARDKEVKEVIVCAAVMAEDGSIYRGHRHGHAMQACRDEGKKLHNGIEQQGFVTTRNRYVLREEARQLQEAAGIPSADEEGYRANTLFSEDLYQKNKDVVISDLAARLKVNE